MGPGVILFFPVDRLSSWLEMDQTRDQSDDISYIYNRLTPSKYILKLRFHIFVTRLSFNPSLIRHVACLY